MPLKLTYKIWLENNGGRAFGEGPYRLLKGVELTGSLREATRMVGMAYSKARRVMDACERSLGFSLIRRTSGGAKGGGSVVTTEAIGLMRSYEELRKDTEEAIAEAYRKHFGQSVQVKFHLMTPPKRKERKEVG